ncbi:MAG: DUF4199 domain-containing protein, partial [Gillisia sp.]
RDKRKDFYDGLITWRQGFVSGILVTVIITLLTPISVYITHEIISPEYFSNIIEYSVENNRMNRNDAEALFSLTSYIIQGTSWALVMGVVTSAIVAWIIRTKKESN